MSKFRRKPDTRIYEPAQWWPGVDHPGVMYDNAYTVEDLDGERIIREGPYVITIHGEKAHLEPGDWIMPEPDKIHHYPIKPDIFAATYEPIQESGSSEAAR